MGSDRLDACETGQNKGSHPGRVGLGARGEVVRMQACQRGGASLYLEGQAHRSGGIEATLNSLSI